VNLTIDTADKYHKLLNWFFGKNPPTVIYLTCKVQDISTVGGHPNGDYNLITIKGYFYLPSGKIVEKRYSIQMPKYKVVKYYNNIHELIFNH
jgi:hypothetical protein